MKTTVETLTMRQIADLKKVTKGKLHEDCKRAEPRTQYQTGPRHGQQIADTRKIAPSWGASVLERIHHQLRAFDHAWALGSW